MAFQTVPQKAPEMRLAGRLIVVLAIGAVAAPMEEPTGIYRNTINVVVPYISTDRSVNYDYDIVYVRALRSGDREHKRYYADFSQPVTMEPGADLMLLHPDGTEELLVRGGEGAITDPVISFDANWVYYTHIYNLRNLNSKNTPRDGADIFKIHLKTRKVVRLTNQMFRPNTGAAKWSRDLRTPEPGCAYLDYGVFNMGPFPLPGGRLVFTSNRECYRPTRGYPTICLQLFVMDDRDVDLGWNEDPVNLEKIGHLNLAGALHPVTLKDGRIMYSSLESQGIRSAISWGIWTIHPDGTNWAPLVSAFDPVAASNGFHFQTQCSDESIIVEEYYNQNNSGFGAYIKLLPSQPAGYPAFGPADMSDSRNQPWRFGRHDNGQPRWYRMPFMPLGSVSLTPFAHGIEGPADHSKLGDKTSPAVGKFTHPSGAPDNHLLTIYSPGPVNHQYNFLPQLDGGIYLIKNSEVIDEPAQMLLIKNDPNYNESWPRAVVTYKRIYGIDEPATIPRLSNDGTISRHLPAGTPFGLVGTSSFYKRETFPNGAVKPGTVTAAYRGGSDPWKGLESFSSHGNGSSLNWNNQGSDAGIYSNDDIHAVRILVMDPTTDHRGIVGDSRFYNHANERLRILGEIPLRKFDGEREPRDPDGNSDTSFAARIPADVAFTFQTLDKNGMVLNMSQTWHQVRPGEMRVNCGGCHAHSQTPTDFTKTVAGRDDYQIWDLVNSTPLLSDHVRDESRRKWDAANDSGLRYLARGPLNVEYYRDIHPILQRSCTACHTGEQPAGNLNLDADHEPAELENTGKFPATYFRLALDERASFGHKPIGWPSWGYPNASRYIRKFQSRRSLLIWKIFGARLDGFSNDDHPSETQPGSSQMAFQGKLVDTEKFKQRYDVDYVGSPMPPPDAVRSGKVKPLTDEDRRTFVRWIDLGCPIDLDCDPSNLKRQGNGWMLDDQRPTLTMPLPQPGTNSELTRIVIGAHDYGSGLNPNIFYIVADFPIDGVPPGHNLLDRFQTPSPGVWELRLVAPVKHLPSGTITVEVADRQGNSTRLKRTFSIR